MDILLLVLRLLLTILLYAFLAAVLLMLWRDLRRTLASRATDRPHTQLIVLDTEVETISSGVAFPLQPVTSVGRAQSNTICIPDAYASAQHALLTWREGQWWLEDCDSRNGTLLNDARINSPTVVSSGDVIGVGRTRLKLELE